MSLVVQQLISGVSSKGTTLTVQDIIDRVSIDTRYQLGGTTPETAVLISYINRVHLELLRWSRWQFLLSPVFQFPTTIGSSDYYIGNGVQAVGSIDTGLAIPDLHGIKRDSVFDRTNFRSLYPTQEVPLLQQFSQNGQPKVWRSDSQSSDVLSIYPAPQGVFTIEFRYFAEPIILANVTDIIQVPDHYQDVLVAGVDEKAFVFLKKSEEAQYWAGVYGEGKRSIIRDVNLFPRGAEFIRPDVVSQPANSNIGDLFYQVLYNS